VADGETGYLVAQRDVETLSERIVRLGRDKALREAMGAAGRELVERLFDAARQIERLEDVLLSCANHPERSKSAH
jgi:glycosyltransferase involved in cell wall biosynthesis